MGTPTIAEQVIDTMLEAHSEGVKNDDTWLTVGVVLGLFVCTNVICSGGKVRADACIKVLSVCVCVCGCIYSCMCLFMEEKCVYIYIYIDLFMYVSIYGG